MPASWEKEVRFNLRQRQLNRETVWSEVRRWRRRFWWATGYAAFITLLWLLRLRP